MGASGWHYRAPYAGSVKATHKFVQAQLLSSGDYVWPWEDFDPEYVTPVPRPRSLPDLNAAKDSENFWDCGTHSILDTHEISESDGVGTIRPLSTTELTTVFGTPQPSAADFDRVFQPGPSGPLADLMGERWTGRSLVLYHNGTPTEVFFWGFSGD
ncbi:hypothetical protein VSH64_24285 [Amycolatopsis rhabdoformis]|uniref:DUF4185 domain-containing protein n=1 Tax=Amycolatopsis rhabdoformis TaxID=1448059 RepID=A0ABZ1HUC2_9PSEU|nr:hypothetical protein [Amycolatopsis rhabdoformis]WSE26002.1 hypothetical protein VSH64_24285 [Amycolatopsis rhabdoformis]